MKERMIRWLSILLAGMIAISAGTVGFCADSRDDLTDTGALSGYRLGYMSWGVRHTGLDVLQEKLENSGKALPEVRVAVIDSGLNTDNRFLKGRYVDGWNFINNTADCNDDQYHGTMVSGIIADATSSNVKILPIKVNDKSGRGNMKNVEKGIYYAIEHDADVINLSLSASDPSHSLTILDEAIEAAVDAGIVVVAAAGNEQGEAGDQYPANKSNVLTVTSIDKNNVIGENANTGSAVDFAMPGVMIWAPYKSGLTSAFVDTGTSLAAPHAAAAAALLKTWDKRVDQDAVYDILKEHAVDLGDAGFDTTYGWGTIDLSDFDISAQYVPPVRYILGDTDGSGAVETVDATWLQRHIAGMETPFSAEELSRGDADRDGVVTITDATAIQRYLAQLQIGYPIGELT